MGTLPPTTFFQGCGESKEKQLDPDVHSWGFVLNHRNSHCGWVILYSSVHAHTDVGIDTNTHTHARARADISLRQRLVHTSLVWGRTNRINLFLYSWEDWWHNVTSGVNIYAASVTGNWKWLMETRSLFEFWILHPVINISLPSDCACNYRTLPNTFFFYLC